MPADAVAFSDGQLKMGTLAFRIRTVIPPSDRPPTGR
jgi:hypothetical protein